jgi:CRISPR-associated endonuclease/helicase Cas3
MISPVNSLSPYSFYKKFLGIESPYEYQLVLWERIQSSKFPLLVKAPTGSGKTEAVLAPFLFQFVENKFYIAPRLIYVLPMRVLVNNIATRIQNYAHKVSPYISVKIQHGDIPDSPFFLSDIIITTLDQFLYGFARASHQVGHHIDIPAGAIASSLVVFDEAHMYRDEFTFSIMRALMEILYQSNVPFVLMSATIPESLENSLFENISISNNQKIIADVKSGGQIRISIEQTVLCENDSVYISDELLDKIKNKRTLIVVNQVKRAQKIYNHIKSALGIPNENIVLLHSRFTQKHRKEHENKAISLIPHKDNGRVVVPNNAGIVISTQVLEAGIDFSAELLLTELAPADSIIQRAGRCARYEGEEGEMIIFPVEDEKGYLPYKREHLTNALNWLQTNKEFNLKKFEEVCKFVNETLDYRANDFEAADTLIDLYECVLYADIEPSNIQIRKSKPVRLLVLDVPEGSAEKTRKAIEDTLRKMSPNSLRDISIDMDIGVAWLLFKNDNRPIQWEIQWRYNSEKKFNEAFVIDLFKGKKNPEQEDSRIAPFKTYVIDKKHYKPDTGIEIDVSWII